MGRGTAAASPSTEEATPSTAHTREEWLRMEGQEDKEVTEGQEDTEESEVKEDSEDSEAKEAKED